MPGMDAAAGTLAVPIWLAGAVAAVLVVAVLLAVKRAGGVVLIASLFRVGLIAAIVLGAWLYVQQRDVAAKDPNPGGERRALEDRKTALMAGAIAPGSALSCLDELAGEAVEAACEKAVFASPEAVAAAVKYVTAQIALLDDGTAYARRGDASYAAELAPLRTALELDRFGLVAQALKEREGCTVDRCDALTQFRDFHPGARQPAQPHLRGAGEEIHRDLDAPRPAEGVVAAAGPPVALPAAPRPRPGTVAPRYDFPSSQVDPAGQHHGAGGAAAARAAGTARTADAGGAIRRRGAAAPAANAGAAAPATAGCASRRRRVPQRRRPADPCAGGGAAVARVGPLTRGHAISDLSPRAGEAGPLKRSGRRRFPCAGGGKRRTGRYQLS